MHQRHSIRLKGYDYTWVGAYFVTLVTQNRENRFGEITDGKIELNSAGMMIETEWNRLPKRYPNTRLDPYVIMPNHLHAIVFIVDGTVGATLVVAQDAATPDGAGAGTRPAPTKTVSLGDIIGAFKSITTLAYIHGVHQSGWPEFSGRLWQRNYYEHIIRDEEELHSTRRYILENPFYWQTDQENPLNQE